MAGRPGSFSVDTVADSRRADEEAFERHVLPEVPLLLRVAMSLTRNRDDAEDLVQETLLRAYQAIGRFDGRYPRAWLLTILRNNNINRWRRRGPALARDVEASERRMERRMAQQGAEEVFLVTAFDETVEAAFADLPEVFGQVVDLVDLGGLSYQEAADRLGVPVGTVMSRLHRARKRMRAQLTGAPVAPRTGRSRSREDR